MWFWQTVMFLKGADGMANIVTLIFLSFCQYCSWSCLTMMAVVGMAHKLLKLLKKKKNNLKSLQNKASQVPEKLKHLNFDACATPNRSDCLSWSGSTLFAQVCLKTLDLAKFWIKICVSGFPTLPRFLFLPLNILLWIVSKMLSNLLKIGDSVLKNAISI